MQDGFTTAREPGSRPIWLVTEASLESWRASLAPTAGNWARASGFAAERHRVLLLPGADGTVAGAALGLGGSESLESITPWATAGLPGKLPQGHWHIETPLAPGAGTRVLLGWLLGRYRFDRYRTGSKDALRPVSLAAPVGADVGWARRAAEGDALARDLINTPAADMGTEDLATAAAQLATRHGGRFSQIVGDDLLGQRLTAIHTVGRAGPQPPRLLDLNWGDAAGPRVTLVGKGVCFDTGGLDLKQASAMALMKKDMGGAACALGLAHMVMDAGLPVCLRVLIPAVENSVASQAFRPGDIIRTRKGITVEVGNTDAEGRLVLADALALADEDQPALLVDMATLTGAARVALGPELPAMYSNDEALASSLCAASAAEADPLWHMPLWAGYDDDISSKVADINNVSGSPFAGSIIGGLFLRRFVSPGTPWIHLDLYGWNPKDRPGRPVGAEAQTLRAVYRLIGERYGTGAPA